MIKVSRRRRVFSLLSWRAIMAHLSLWFTLLLLATAQQDRNWRRDRNGRRHWRGMGAAASDTNTGSPVSPNVGSKGPRGVSTCRDAVTSGNYSRVFKLISDDAVQLDPFAIPLHLNGTSSKTLAVRQDVCPGIVSSCSEGLTVAMWLHPGDTSVPQGEKYYYLSNGAQRRESCGFYFRLDSVISSPEDGSLVGVFDVGTASFDTFWKIRYRATMMQKTHVLISWSPDLGMDVYVDGVCAGTVLAHEGFQRSPVASCIDDPFLDMYIGGRNDRVSRGHPTADIGQLLMWDAWMNPDDVYNSTDEGVLRAYYENCLLRESISSSFQLLMNSTSIPDGYFASHCRSECLASGYKYVAIGGDGPSCCCYCVANYTYSKSHPIGSCNVCSGYTEITCGHMNSMSVYHTTSFLGGILDQTSIQGLSVSVDGVPTGYGNYTVVTHTNVNVSFSVTAGENVRYSLRGDARLKEIHTFESSTYLYFPEEGLYHLIVLATNELSSLEMELWITAQDDPARSGKLVVTMSSDGLAAVSHPVMIWADLANQGPNTTCTFDFGDGAESTFLQVESSLNLIHQYTNAGVFLVTAQCAEAGNIPTNASTTVIIQEPVTIILNTTFRVLKGANTTIPFQITGTNVTGVEILYDGEAFVGNYTCSAGFICEGLLEEVQTNTTGTHVFEVRASNLISVSESSRADVYIGVPIRNLTYEINATAVATNEGVELTAHITDGTLVYFHFTFDGNSTVFQCPKAPCQISHTESFAEAGDYEVFVEVSNDFNALKSEIYLVEVYNPVSDLSIDVVNSSSTQEPVQLIIYPTSNTSKWPTEATAVISIEGFANPIENSFTPSSPVHLTITYFLSIPLYGIFEASVNVSNAISTVVINVPIQIGHGIAGFYAELSSEMHATRGNVSLQIGYAGGSEVAFSVDFGDGTRESLLLDMEVGNLSNQSEAAIAKTTIYHQYSSPGDYVINVQAQNAFGDQVRTLPVSIFNQIEGLRMETNGINQATGTPIMFDFFLDQGAAISPTMTCSVDYGDGSDMDFWTGILSQNISVITEHTYRKPETLQVLANCSNEVSHVVLSVTITLQVPVHECSINTVSQVATKTDVLYHALVSTGSDLTLSINYEDGSTGFLHIGGESGQNQTQIFEHAYNQAGSYTAQLSVSNAVSSCVAYSDPVLVQVPILNDSYILLVPKAIDISNQSTILEISLTDNTSIPTDVTAYWSFGDGATSNTTLLIGTSWTTSHIYKNTGVYSVGAYLFNKISELTFNDTLAVLEKIGEIDYNIRTITPVATNLTLTVYASSGSSIKYSVDFGDGTIDTRFEQESELLEFVHSYDQAGNYDVTIHAENALSETVINDIMIMVVNPVEGLNFEASDDVLYNPGNVTFSLSIDGDVPPPTAMECTWEVNNGSGVKILKTETNVTVIPGSNVSVIHEFQGGQFEVSLDCENILGGVTFTKNVTVYEKIQGLKITSKDLVAEVGSRFHLTVTTVKGSLVDYVIQFGDGQTDSRRVISSFNTKLQDFHHLYSNPGVFVPSVTATNVLGQKIDLLNESIKVLHSTRGFQLSSNSPLTFPKTLVTFTLDPIPSSSPPSTVDIVWYFGDTTSKGETIDVNRTHGIIENHHYNKSGSYLPTVTLSNHLDSHTFATIVIINGEIEPVRVGFEYKSHDGILQSGFGPESNWFPVGSEIKMNVNSTPTDASILWDLDNGETSSQNTIYQRYETPGVYNISLQVRSDSSEYTEQHSYTFYIVDQLSLTSIQINDADGTSVLKSGSQVEFSLTGNGLDGPSCITWDAGDKSPQTTYGPVPCQLVSQNTSIKQPQRDGLLFTHVYTSPGSYVVNVSVTNFFSTAYQWREITIVGCRGPPQVSIKGPGSTADAPRSHRTSEAVLLDSTISLDCFGISSTSFDWDIQRLITNETQNTTNKLPYDLHTSSGPRLYLSPGSLKFGLYEISLTVTINGFKNATGIDTVYVQIEHSPLVLVIEGGSKRAVGNAHPLVLDAKTSSYDPDNTAGNTSDWSFTWSCQKLSNEGKHSSNESDSAAYLCDSGAWELLNFTTAMIQLDPARLQVSGVYTFRVEASINSRLAAQQQTVEVAQGEVPLISIRCVSNCRDKTNPTSSFTLQGSCDNCAALGVSVFTWSLFVKDQSTGKYEVVDALGNMTSTGISKQGLAFNPNQLEAGREYQLQLNVMDQLLGTGFTQYLFVTNLPPYNGSCHVTPTTGYVINTEFTVYCTGWLDEGYATDRSSISPDLAASQVLQYRVKSRPRGQAKYSLKTSSTDSLVSGVIFELGPEQFDYILELQIEVVDVFGSTAYTDLTITVKRPDLSSDDLTSLVSSNGSSLSQLVSSGNVEHATQLISAVLSLLPSEKDTNSSWSAKEVTELRSQLVLELSKMSVWAKTLDSLLQASGTMAQSVTGDVNDKALLAAAASMTEMAMTLDGLVNETPESVIDTAHGLTGGLGSLISQSDSLVENAMGTSQAAVITTTPSSTGTSETVVNDDYGDDLSPEEIAEQAEIAEEERQRNEQNARDAALTISMLAQETLNLVSEVIVDQRVSGQPPVTLVTDQLTLEVFKDEPNSVAGRSIATGTGSFQLPNATVLFGDAAEKQVEQTMYSFSANPYSFSRSSANIGSSVVLSLEFTTGQGMPISVNNLTESISIMLEADQSRLESAETVRMTFQNDSSWAYHKVELTDDNIELRVIFTETSNNASTFHVYLRKGSRPDMNTFDAHLEIPRDLGEQEHWDEVKLETEARHTAVFPHDTLAGAGDYYLRVGLAGPASSGSVMSTPINQTHTSDSVNVTLIIYAAGCRYWDTDIIAWSSEGCQVGPLTTSHSTHCLCNHLSSFAASFFVPPNTIDFSTVFSKFKDLGDNAAVFSTVVGFFGLYLILLVWLRRKDKQDIVKWGVSPLADNHPSDTYFYQVTVQTGLGPGCGTRSKVSMIITGEDGDSGARLLDDEKRKVFVSGSICHFLMGVAGPLGPLSYIKLWHDNSGRGQNASWYLSQVSITDLQSGQQFFFVCDRWLAVEKDDGSVERVLPIATRSDLTQFSKLFYSSSRRNLFDDHIWFSLFSRPTRSSFTRVQRLSCCLCLLYLSMIASAMFYRAEEAVENLQALRLGPFIFTLQQVYIGIISAVIVIPVNLVIVQVFRKSKPSKSQLANQLPEHLQARLDHLKDGSSETSTPSSSVVDVKSDKTELVPDDSSSRSKSKNKKSKNKPFLLPHWCIYIAWLLMILSSLAAAFFTVLYSLEWGQQKSSEWLTSMLISLFNSVLVIQPVKVVVIAMIVAIIFKKPSKMDIEIDTEFSSDHNQLKRDEELLHQPYSSVYSNSRFYPPPSKAELEEARKMRLKEQRMNEILRETVIYSIFVTVVLFLCYSARDSMSFYMTKSLKDIFVENNGAENLSTKLTLSSLEKSTPDLFWRWVETALIPGLYGGSYYNGEPMHWRHTRFIGDWQGYRVGPVRLRQLRVKNGSCQLLPDMSTIQPTCHLEYSWTNQDETNYSIAWQPKTPHNPRLYSAQENAPWIYQDFLDLNGLPYSGILAVYSGGGYVAEFGTTTARALSTTQFLRQNNWYDALTRAIFVEFSVYNANANLFSVTTLLVETSTVGGALVSSTIHTLRLYHYDGPIAVFTIIFQVIFVAYLVYFFVKLILAVKKGGLKELKNFWLAVELTMLLLAIATIVMFAFRQIFIEFALKDVKNKDQGEFVNFSHIAKWDELFGYLLAAMAFLAIIRYMRLLRLNARMSLLGMTLGHASKDIIHFLLVWNLIFLAFGQLTYKIFHTAVASFSSFLRTLETLFSMLLGKFDFNAMVEANRVLGGIIFVVYIMTMYMILSNMFITIVVEAFSHMRQDQGLDDAVDPEMVEYMVEKFKAFFLWPLQGGNQNNLQPKAEMTTYEDPMELLEQRVDKISRLVEASYRQLEASNGSPTGGSPVRSLSRISLHSARSATGVKDSPKPQRSRTILIA